MALSYIALVTGPSGYQMQILKTDLGYLVLRFDPTTTQTVLCGKSPYAQYTDASACMDQELLKLRKPQGITFAIGTTDGH